MIDSKSIIFGRRAIITTFFISILAGGAFQKGLELFYNLGFPVSLDSKFLMIWSPLFVLLSFIIRFYIGRLLYLKTLEENPPNALNFSWGYDFSLIIMELSILYFYALTFKNNNIDLFFKLIITLLFVDCFWIFSMYLIGKTNPKFVRKSIPWPWFEINCSTMIIILILFPSIIGPYDSYLCLDQPKTKVIYLSIILLLSSFC